jgi:hypothetical protein
MIARYGPVNEKGRPPLSRIFTHFTNHDPRTTDSPNFATFVLPEGLNTGRFW